MSSTQQEGIGPGGELQTAYEDENSRFSQKLSYELEA
jgi:hypothetical protein